MKSNSDKNNLAENKVLILYILTKLNNTITNNGLFNIISAINGLNYFYFQQTLNNLIETGLVGYTDDEKSIVKITAEGEKAYYLTKELLPGIVKLKADNIFDKEVAEIKNESSVSAEFIPKNENEYTVKCKIVENNETVFEVETFAGSRERAKKICDNWNNNANNLYPRILRILLDK